MLGNTQAIVDRLLGADAGEARARAWLRGVQAVRGCSFCARVRAADGEWHAAPATLRASLDAWLHASHGVCPECFAREYPEHTPPG